MLFCRNHIIILLVLLLVAISTSLIMSTNIMEGNSQDACVKDADGLCTDINGKKCKTLSSSGLCVIDVPDGGNQPDKPVVIGDVPNKPVVIGAPINTSKKVNNLNNSTTSWYDTIYDNINNNVNSFYGNQPINGVASDVNKLNNSIMNFYDTNSNTDKPLYSIQTNKMNAYKDELDVEEELYILKSQIIPPVCPICPSGIPCKNKIKKKCQPCPPCAKCPEPSFECKKVPNYSSTRNAYLPKAILTDFTQYGM